MGTRQRKIYTGNIQCYPCLSLCVLCPMLPVSIILCLVPNVTRVYLSVYFAQCYPCLSFCVLCPMLPASTGHRKIDIGKIGHKKQKYRHRKHWTQDTERETRETLDTRHRKIDTYNIGHLHVAIFLCLVPNVTRVYIFVSCVQWYPCLSFCVLCPMLPVAIFLCLVERQTRVTLGTIHRKIDKGNIRHKTQKDRHG
jgi:hypothetical protein